MSKYEWERGEIIIPAKEWAGFRKGLLMKWNAKQVDLLADAEKAYAALKAAAKGTRGTKRQDAMKHALGVFCGGRSYGDGTFDFRTEDQRERYDTIFSLVFKQERWNSPVTLQKPQRKALALKAVTKDATVTCDGEASVTFCNKTRSVFWDVPENNHACEHARNHWFAKALFSALNRITWTRGSGGTIVGNDEYNSDSDYEGGGGNYITTEFSQAATKRKKKAASRRSMYDYPSRGYGW